MALARRFFGSPFDPAVYTGHHLTLTAAQVVEDMQVQLRQFQVQEVVWGQVLERMSRVDLAALQIFFTWACSRGHTGLEAPPSWRPQRDKALAQAMLGSQRAAGGSARGVDHLLPPGLGQEEHIRQARQLSSPFSSVTVLDDDLLLAVQCVFVFGPYIGALREAQHQRLRDACDALSPLRRALLPFRCRTARKVVAGRDASLNVFATALLRWPDRSQGAGCLTGLRVVGDVEAPAIFKELPAGESVDLERNFYGRPAEQELHELKAGQPPKDADLIYSETMEEVGKGFCDPPVSERTVHRMFGRGNWRVIHRFMVHQHDRCRMIDDGRRGGQNTATRLVETIRCIGLDFVPQLASALARLVTLPYQQQGWDTSWMELFASTDDLPDALRGVPLHEDDVRATVVAIWHPMEHEWQYILMHGCPFGLGSVVLTFNRYPALVVALMRRALFLFHGAYFDDNILLDVEVAAPRARDLLHHWFSAFGTPPKDAKH